MSRLWKRLTAHLQSLVHLLVILTLLTAPGPGAMQFTQDAARRLVPLLSVVSAGALLALMQPATMANAAPPGLVSKWTAEGNADDVVDGNSGGPNGASYYSGHSGYAFSLDGRRQYVEIPDAPSLKPANITIAAWVRFDALDTPGASAPGAQYIVFKKNTRSGAFEGYALAKRRVNGVDKLHVVISSASGVQRYLDSSTTVEVGRFYHVASTYDGSKLKLYVNGANEGEIAASFPLDYGTRPVFFGTTGEANWDGKLHGLIDEVQIYNRALTADEIASLAGAPPPPRTEHAAPFLHGLTSHDPVHTYTGSFSYVHTDVAIPGRGPSPVFTRTYNSDDTRVSPLGPGWTHSYYIRLSDPGDGTGDLVLVGPQGRSDRFTRNADGSYTPRAGTSTTLIRNAAGTYTATHQDQSTWTFSEVGRLVSLKDRYGNQSNLTYNANGQLTSISDPAGRGSLTLGYNAGGRLISISDWLSPTRVVQFGYDSSGRLRTVTDRTGKTTTYAYNGTTHRLTTITDARGNIAVTNTYDPEGRVATQKDARGLVTGQQTTFNYVENPDGTRTTTVTYPATSFEPTWHPQEIDTYDAQGRIVQRVSKPTSNAADDVVTQYAYDANSNLAAVTDARGNTTNFCYDVDYAGVPIPGSRGNLTRRIDPPPTPGANRPVTLYQYDAKNNLIQTIPPKGVAAGTTVDCATDLSSSIDLRYATDNTYDSATQTTLEAVTHRSTDPDTSQQVVAITTFEYQDAANPGLVTRIIPPRGNTGPTPDSSYATSFTYFASGSKAGMLESVTDPLGNTTTYDYDPVGRRLTMVDPLGNAPGANPADHTWEYEFDNEDRLRFTRAPAPSSGGSQLVTEFRYDAVGNRDVAIDANGQVTRYLYDERDALQEVWESPNPWTDPAVAPSPKIVTTYAYDHAGNLTRVTRAKGDATHERVVDYRYDGANRLRTETQFPSWPSTGTTLVTQHTYDANGNRTTLRDPLGQTTTFAYDALNRLTSIDYEDVNTPDVAYQYDAHGNRTEMVDGTGTTTYQYDELDRLLSVTSPGPTTVGYRYDLDGNRTQVIYPDNTTVTATFDEASRLESLLDWANRTTSYQYFPDGSLQQVTNPNGTVAEFTYDNARRLTDVGNQQASNTITRHTYTLDAVGNRTQVDELLSALGTPGTTTPVQLTYTYDRLSRLTNVTAPSGPTTYAYDPVGNRLSKTAGAATSYSYDRADRITAAGATSYTVDANGNLVARGSDSFAYDQANRLTSATIGGATSTYTYDGDGKRASKTVGGTTISYVYDANRLLPVVLDDGSRKYVWGAGLAYLVDKTTGAIEVYHTDGLGSVRAITDAAGNIVQTYTTDEFGVPTQTQGTSTNPFQYTGEQRDAESGFVYLRARVYDPAIGRFLQRDPLPGSTVGPQTLHRYTYANNNPVSLTDPSGHVAVVAIVGAAVVLVEVGTFVLDAVTTAQTLSDPNASLKEKLLASGLFVVGAAGPGGGYATVGSQALRHGDELADALRIVGNACSFSGDTLVATAEGAVPIREIEIGDRVLAYDEATETVGYYTVTAVWAHEDAVIVHLTIDGVRLETTPEHPFFVEGKGWVPAGELQVGDHVREADGEWGVVAAIATERRPQVMYNLTVDEAHTYFVGDQQWQVHNTCRLGGRYKDIAANGGQIHHMPAASVSPMAYDDGPAIWMETADHMKTASWGNSRAARAYRDQQRQLIEQGQFEDAIIMDIDDVRSLFGSKYDEGILQMIDSLGNLP